MKRIRNCRLIVQSVALIITALALFTTNDSLRIPLLAIMLLGGAFYCGWICPFGFLQDMGSRIGKLIGIRKRKVPEFIHGILVYSRYIFAVMVALVASEVVFTILGYEPRGTAISMLTGEFPTCGVLGAMMAFMVAAMVYERPYCRFFCITGASYGAISMFRIFTIRRNTHWCVNCGKCDRACPMQIQVGKVKNIRSPQCINCLECISTCPVKNALSFGMIRFKKCSNGRISVKSDSPPGRKHESA